MRLLLFILLLTLFLPTTSAALPGQMNLKHGYQMFILPTRDPELWGEFEKIYYHGNEIRLNNELLQKIPKEKLERKKVKGINRAYLEQFLKDYIVEKINQKQESAELYLHKDKVKIVGNIRQGKKLNIPLSVKIIETALKEGIDEVELAVDITEPKLKTDKTLTKLGIKEIVALGESDFSGSSKARIHNIQTAMKRFEGVIIPPQENFSFNALLGEVDSYTGYEKELVIKGANTIPEYGGGVCQVSSTLYRSVMISGLPIHERANHSYAVSYYTPYGSDATIYPGSRDFQFKNNMSNSIAIHSYIKDEKLYFVLLGTKENMSVDLFGPYISNPVEAPPTRYVPSTTLADGEKYLISPAHGGFTSTWFRRAGENVERYKSVYEARPKIYKVGGLLEEKIGSLN